MFLRILRKSLLKRKTRIFIAIISVIIGASVATALLSVSFDVSEKVGEEFRRYGANLLVVPESDTIDVGFPGVNFGSITEQRYINESELWKIRTIYWRNNVLGFTPLLYQVVKIGEEPNQQDVVLVGTYFNKKIRIEEPYSPNDPDFFTTGIESISPWWSVEGSWIMDPDDSSGSMVGINVAEKLDLNIGDDYSIKYSEIYNNGQNETAYNLTVTGIIESGGNEDDQVFVNLHIAQHITSRSDKVHTVQVSALCNACPVDTFAEEIEGKLSNIDARSVKQLVNAEMNILGKIENMMFMVTIIALLASALGVMTTMTTSVIERKKEIGLMKSVGAENKKIVSLFFSEASIIGIIGGISGFIIGVILSQFIGISVFNTFINPRYEIIPVVLIISIVVALIASVIPIRKAVKVEPAIVLRGE
jgi:putative ABC transport system permease protein